MSTSACRESGSASIPEIRPGTRSGSGWPIAPSPGTSSLRPSADFSAPANGKLWSKTLGPDPLRADGDPDEVWRRLYTYRGALGAALLDQSVVAGVGNVLRAESLFAAGLQPRPAGVDA